MISRKCPKCGLVSFNTAASCKGCHASSKVSDEAMKVAISFEAEGIDDDKPRSAFSPLRVLLLILLLAVPGWLYYRSQEKTIALEKEQQKKAAQEESRRSFEESRKGCWNVPMSCQ